MKKLLFALAAMPFIAGAALAADRLSDAQMVRITAGALPDIVCPSCLSSNSMSTSTNGVTQTMSTSGSTGTGSTGSGSTGSGSTGSGSTGSGSTGSGSTGSNSNPGAASRSASVVLPSIFISSISGAAGFTPMVALTIFPPPIPRDKPSIYQVARSAVDEALPRPLRLFQTSLRPLVEAAAVAVAREVDNGRD